ncbi:hypothetical protein ACRAWF_36415 [Streptomyces sp. L7]
MVKGSKTKYDTYTYRLDSGVEKGIISGKLGDGWEPVDLQKFQWDAVPALLARAAKVLNVKNPTSRYLLVEGRWNVFNEPAHMSVYLGDDYGSGYLEADPQGKVIKTYPADG